MVITRRKALVMLAAFGIIPSAFAYPDDYLWGTWVLKCPNCGSEDTVTQGTAQHECEKCGKQVFQDGKVTVVCPKEHPNKITVHGRVESVICKVCNVECCRG